MAQVLWNADIDVYNDKVIPVTVARSISLFLEIPDLLSFSLVSKNAHKAVKDPALWVSKLQKMGIWDDANSSSIVNPNELDFEFLKDPLRCLSEIYMIPKLARLQMLKIRNCLEYYYNDLQSNVAYNHLKIFTSYSDPRDQAKLLSNMLKYNMIDLDDNARILARQKITDLIEIFENALLRELEIHYDINDYENTKKYVAILIDLKNEQTLIDFFLQKTCFDNESIRFLNPEFFNARKFFENVENLHGVHSEHPPLKQAAIVAFIDELASVFNALTQRIDRLFPPTIPIMYRICEELITNQLHDLILALVFLARKEGLYLDLVPALYTFLSRKFINKLVPCENVGVNYHNIVHQLLDVSYETFLSEYLHEELENFKDFCSNCIEIWKRNFLDEENKISQSILKYVKAQSKGDFLANFKKVFVTPGSLNSINDVTPTSDKVTLSKEEADAKILTENIKSLKNVFSPDLAYDILQAAKRSLERIYQFRKYTLNTVLLNVHETIQAEYMNALECIGTDHLKVGFEKALQYLKDYHATMPNIDEITSKASAIDPLKIFFQSIHTADMIVQMLDIFYKEEILNRSTVKNENSILNPSLQSKRQLESMVDKFVADGLNIGIEVLFEEIESVYLSTLRAADYNPTSGALSNGPTKAARRVVSILEENIDLLVGSAEKSIIEVFQQEVAERFFQAIVKSLKRSTISVDGAVVLIFDLNLYYDFILNHISSNKRLVHPLFQALKKVGTIFLIGGQDAKAIGQIVSDLSKFNGIFSQEEIYEFVQRRQDWQIIKKHVEKVMYGLSLVDCAIV